MLRTRFRCATVILTPTNEDTMMEDSRELRLLCAGAIGVLCDCSTKVDEEARDQIERVVSDWCKLTGWTYSRLIDSIEVIPPPMD